MHSKWAHYANFPLVSFKNSYQLFGNHFIIMCVQLKERNLLKFIEHFISLNNRVRGTSLRKKRLSVSKGTIVPIWKLLAGALLLL
jgi:hypothetical protein